MARAPDRSPPRSDGSLDRAWVPHFSPADLIRAGFRGHLGARSPATPIYLCIARLLSDEIRRGRLRAGGRLPATRALARMLGVNRNTVVAAYAELANEGWLTTHPASGTFVSDRLPDLSPRRFTAASTPRPGVPDAPGYELRPAGVTLPAPGAPENRKGGLYLWGGVPDLSLVPTAALARAYRRAVTARGGASLNYVDGRGDARLRGGVARMLSATRGLAAGAEDVMITRGSQMAIDLVARVLLRPGDVVAVEELGYPRAWDAFRRAGAKLISIPVDEHGVNVDAVADLLARRRVRALYLTPHHQYPSTVVLSAARRIALLDLARRERVAIVEDDYDHEFHYDGRPVMPLASADAAGVVIYIGTFSKVLAPGLRLGFTVAPRTLLARLAELREGVDRQGDMATESAVADLMEEGELERHTRRMRRIYQARRDAFVTLLRGELDEALSFRVPPGGMSLWARVARGIDAEAWCARAAERGVGFVTGAAYVLADDAPARRRWRGHVRLGYARYDVPRLEEAVRRMVAGLSDVGRVVRPSRGPLA